MTKPFVLILATLIIAVSAQPAGALSIAQTATDGLPDIARELIDEAARTGNPQNVNAVAQATANVLPTFADAIKTYQAQTLGAMPQAQTATGAAAEEAAAQSAEAASDGDVTQTADAAPAEAPKPTGLFALAPWKGSVNLAAVNASGNADNAAVGFALNAARTSGKLTHNVGAYIDIGQANDILSQKRWGANYKLDYAISERWYAFGRIAYDEDQFSGFDYRIGANAGIGHFIAKSDPFTWKVEAGPGYRISLIDDTDERQNNFSAYAASDIDWVIREGLTFTSDLAVTWTEPTSTFEATHGINAALFGGLTAGLSHYYRYETSPPLGRVNSDNVIRATLGYGF